MERPRRSKKPSPAEVFAKLWKEMAAISERLTPHEPSTLEGIRKLRRAEPVKLTGKHELTREEVRGRIRAALEGETIGCMLGKPLEHWSDKEIQHLLADCPVVKKYYGDDLYPLRDYVPGNAAVHATHPFHDPKAVKEVLVANGASLQDDDTDYTALMLKVLKECGRDATTEDIAKALFKHIPAGAMWTAERIWLRNRLNHLSLEDAATWGNPLVEWIGAVIRANAFGYVNPGNPRAAAEMAYRDAVITHRGNGIYGEMYFAAAIAAAFKAETIEQALDAACAEIPQDSRFAKMANQCHEWQRAGLTWDEFKDKIYETYADLHWVHTLNNSAIIIGAALYFGHDFNLAVAKCVEAGLDTDSTAEILGALLGAFHGPENMNPLKAFSDPLNGRMTTSVAGPLTFDQLTDIAMESVVIEVAHA